jgi:hypothetical protein
LDDSNTLSPDGPGLAGQQPDELFLLKKFSSGSCPGHPGKSGIELLESSKERREQK